MLEILFLISSKMKELENLNISFNCLGFENIAYVFMNLPQVKYLCISENNFEYSNETDWKNLTKFIRMQKSKNPDILRLKTLHIGNSFEEEFNELNYYQNEIQKNGYKFENKKEKCLYKELESNCLGFIEFLTFLKKEMNVSIKGVGWEKGNYRDFQIPVFSKLDEKSLQVARTEKENNPNLNHNSSMLFFSGSNPDRKPLKTLPENGTSDKTIKQSTIGQF